jgi:glycosyltransferase involved in cell wall biosynthesis
VGASIRLVKLMKYVAEHGWSFAVITQDIDQPVVAEQRLGDFLLAELPAGTTLTRIAQPFAGNGWLARLGRRVFPTSGLPWALAVIAAGWRQYRRRQPDLVFVNSPPFTNVLIGVLLATLLGVPLVIDMKDDWVDSPVYWQRGRLRRAVEAWVEARMFQRAAAVVTVTPSSHAATVKRYARWRRADKFHCVPNGLDLDEYRALAARPRQAAGPRLRLVSAAVGYRPDYRDLTPLLQALERWLERRPDARTQIEIEFLGDQPHPSYKQWLARLLPAEVVRYPGSVDRQTLVERLWGADLLFLVQPRGNTTAVAGTLYEYWATGKAPILLFAETGASSRLVTEHQLGAHFHFADVDAAADYLERVATAFFAGQPIWIERAGVEAFDRRTSASQMAAIWAQVIKRPE